jgi:hypothetical protein
MFIILGIILLATIILSLYLYFKSNTTDTNNTKKSVKENSLKQLPKCEEPNSIRKDQYTPCQSDKLTMVKDSEGYYIIPLKLSDNKAMEGVDTRFLVAKKGDYLYYISNLPVNCPIEVIFTSDIGIFKINLKTDNNGNLYFNNNKTPIPVVLLKNTIIEINYDYKYIVTDINFLELGLGSLHPLGHYTFISLEDRMKLDKNTVIKVGNNIGNISNGEIEF